MQASLYECDVNAKNRENALVVDGTAKVVGTQALEKRRVPDDLSVLGGRYSTDQGPGEILERVGRVRVGPHEKVDGRIGIEGQGSAKGVDAPVARCYTRRRKETHEVVDQSKSARSGESSGRAMESDEQRTKMSGAHLDPFALLLSPLQGPKPVPGKPEAPRLTLLGSRDHSASGPCA